MSSFLFQVKVHENSEVLKTETSLVELQQEDSHMVSVPPNVFYLLVHECNLLMILVRMSQIISSTGNFVLMNRNTIK